MARYYKSKKNGKMEDHPSKYMGHGEFANMPQEKIMKSYPKSEYGYGEYGDTIRGIDSAQEEAYKKVKKYPSKQKG